MPIKTRTIELDGDYAGWTAEIRTNLPLRIVDAFRAIGADADDAAAEGVIRDALCELVVAWDFVDVDGEPLPLPKDGGLGELDPDLLGLLAAGFLRVFDAVEEAAELPKA